MPPSLVLSPAWLDTTSSNPSFISSLKDSLSPHSISVNTASISPTHLPLATWSNISMTNYLLNAAEFTSEALREALTAIADVSSSHTLTVFAPTKLHSTRLSVLYKCNFVALTSPYQFVDCIVNYSLTLSNAAIKLAKSSYYEQLGIDLSNKENRPNKGHTNQQAWKLMLSSLFRISPALAASIAEKYPSFRSLYSAYDNCASDSDRQLLLASIVIQNSSRRIGASMSKRIYTQLYSANPDQSLETAGDMDT